jgi:cytochrome P450
MLFDETYFENPYRQWAKLREQEGAVVFEPSRSWWCILGHPEARQLGAGNSLSSERSWQKRFSKLPVETRAVASDFERQLRNSILVADPPKHTRIRTQATKPFGMRSVERWRPRIEALAAELLGRRTKPECDLIADFAYPLAAQIIMEVLGVPVEDRDRLKAWTAARVEFLGGMTIAPNAFDLGRRASEAVRELEAYFGDLIAERQQRPRDDFISNVLATQQGEGRTLSEEELVALFLGLLTAGHETTTNLIGSAILSLINNPDEKAILLSGGTEIEKAVDEFLRYEPPEQMMGRVATQDIEVGGKLVREGEAVLVLTGAVNRDPRVFADPDRLDLRRTNNPHLSFGFDRHSCFGAQLAKLEAQIAIELVLRRHPEIQLSGQEPPRWIRNASARGLSTLVVRTE